MASVNLLYSAVLSMSAVLFRFCMLIVVVTVVGCGAAVVVVAASVVPTVGALVGAGVSTDAVALFTTGAWPDVVALRMPDTLLIAAW